MAQAKSKPAIVTVFLGKGDPEIHNITDFKDWAVIFEDVLEVKTDDQIHYYPLDSVKKWIVKN